MSVISHVCLGTADLARAVPFYAALFEELGLRLRFHEPENGWAGWMPRDADRPLVIVGWPWDGDAPNPGNGLMTALTARSRASVDRCHALALAAGGTCEGPPDCGRIIIRPITAPTFAISTATSFAWRVTSPKGVCDGPVRCYGRAAATSVKRT
ncbi:hypothetical protein PUR29_27105 [Methylobacterium ajmalii]|uniref:Lactoylglutathione lyase and related lyases n=2 Tax=Methylobacterium TaxID=407 RepID=A0A0C6FK67_9HYPH|nr:lactoylglutathione lyase and related lyases [Methylobacterium aquaticum]